MAKRKRVGLVFSYNESWIAGTYYILNIINSLKVLPLKEQPQLIIVSEKVENFDILIEATEYPFLEFFQFPFALPNYSTLERGINKLFRFFGVKKLIAKKPKQPKFDFLYPNEIEEFKVTKLKKVNWVPDFQEAHLPNYFPKKEIDRRVFFQKQVVCKGDVVVFSSINSMIDFDRLYAEVEIDKVVIPFAVTHPDFSKVDINSLRDRYHLFHDYFFVPNQFWAHKNHMLVLKALEILQNSNKNIIVAFSGKESDYRNKDYVDKLKVFIEEKGISDSIRFLGFLDRKDQLCLMDNSIGIIQPSLFEGWSTVVEDAKALNKFIILSSLDVHKEQISENVHFFDPHNAHELAEILILYAETPPKVNPINYFKNRIDFANGFMKMVNNYSH